VSSPNHVETRRLGEFILENMEPILAEWEDYARRYWRGALPDSAALRNHADIMLRAVVADMAAPQSGPERKAKSEGAHQTHRSEMNKAAIAHALARIQDGFNIQRMVAEFRALRASVNRLWWTSLPAPHPEQINDMVRFNESLDQLIAASVNSFTERVEQNRRLFLGMLGHDLRQPLYSLKMFTEILMENGNLLPPKVVGILSSMARCCDHMSSMLHDLLDFTSSQLGSTMPVNLRATGLDEICCEVLAEIRATAPDREFRLETSGALKGEWDASRLRQMVSNLLQNAVQHGDRDHPITVSLSGNAQEISVAIHNSGIPIPEDAKGILFDPMVRLASRDEKRPLGSIGLGLYICRQIVRAHHGRIKVESSAEDGTTFTVTLPRHPPQDLHSSHQAN
jgi:signal transduction histidine kinase